MVDSLRTFSELLAQVPDNTSQLITAQDVREYLYALPLDLIEVQESDRFTAVMTDGVWVDIPTLMPSPTIEVARAWIADANNKLVPNFTATVDVDPALVRGVSYTPAAIVEKLGVSEPLTGNWANIDGDGAPAVGDINWHSNETQCRVSHTDDDGGDRQVELEATEVGDYLNAGGIFRQCTAVVLNAGDVEFTFASTPRPTPTGGGDPTPAFQILRTGASPYELRVTQGGSQIGLVRSFELSSSASLITANEFAAFLPADLSPWSFEIRPIGHSTDIDVLDAQHRIFGVLV